MSLSAGPGGRAGGFVLVAVLLLLTAVGLIAVAMSLEAGLATLGARAAAGASAARPAARAALVLALDEVVTAAAAGLEPPETFGPWTLGAAGAGARSAFVGGAEETVYELTAVATVGRARAEATAVVTLTPEPRVLEWREP